MSKNIPPITKKKRKANRSKKVGLPAGSLVYFGNKEKPLNIEVISYNDSSYSMKKVVSAEEALNFITDSCITWLNVNGLNNIEEVNKLGNYVQLNNLLLEDILDTEHRPKVEILDEHILVIIKMLYYGKDEQLISEHLALVLGKNYLITFQESEGEDVFEPVRKRLQNTDSSLRKRPADYLLFGLLDAIVDNYFVILDKVSDKIETIEDEIITHPREDMISEIQLLKKSAIFLQKSIMPSREVVNKIEKNPHHLIDTDTKHYFRDLHDHTIQIVETLSTYRDILWGLTDTYMGAMSNKMNNIMRLLTLISTIFIPLTFIVGVYGMNFKYMPELELWWAYPLVWLVIIGISVAMIFYFKRKKWL
ncbi:magnesium/cobalt transporter CorA [Capnocytophaga sputigena]|uniref:magnesium/cobalt transporter CorA n=1 Tax=Capnocytophaga sputigena TaxID=1019 RepID=UPI0028D3CD9B|nr:magnesium/cobalt transporter CorA [Capnocytophaga sputigena]